MSAAAAFVAAGCGVAGLWDLLAAVEQARIVEWLHAAVRPLGRARREGRLPSTAERRRLTLLICVALLAAGWIVAGPLVGALAAVGGPAASGALLAQRRRLYRERLALEAPQAARALAAALAAGRSVRSAVGEAGLGLDGPVGHELRAVRKELDAGMPTGRALLGLRSRAGSRAWDTLVAAVLVQREAGGDLPGLLRDLAAAQEAAARTDQDARAATAQARFTARLVAGLPFGAVALAELGSPGFTRGLLSHPLSLVLVALAALLQAVAFTAVRAISRRLATP